MIRPLPYTHELERVARNTVWFKTPAEAIANPYHLIAHVLTFGMYEDVKILRRYLTEEEFREAIEQAPPGIFDPRSWAYWNLKIGRYPAPPLPKRNLN